MQCFSSGEEFKDQLLQYVLKTQYDIKLCRWEQTKLGAVCTNINCKWKIYCAVEKSEGKWMVKKFSNVHNHTKTGKARMLNQHIIALLFKDEARRRPGISWKDIKVEIKMRYNISVTKWICIKARREALDMVLETQKSQFAKLWDYDAELRRSNPNTSTEVVTIPNVDGRQVFDKYYICFEALRKIWIRHCRPIIGLDGAFLKWELKGEVLAVVGRDSDNRIYPIAWAIVRVEDNDSWAWFINKLKFDLQLGFGNGYTIISDKQKGLVNALADILPNAEHRLCARHIFANFKKVHSKPEFETYFWRAAFSYTKGDFQYNVEKVKKHGQKAYDDLMRTDPHTWCRAYFSQNARCADVCNNLSESFNRTIREARKLPLINMLEEIRRLAMKQISRRSDFTTRYEPQFPPRVMAIFEQCRVDSTYCDLIKSNNTLFEVVESDGSYEVRLPYKHCACNQWDVTGIPCRHAVHVITEQNLEPSNYVDPLFLTSKWREIYAENIRPVNGERLWTKTGKDPIAVPDKRRMSGRPIKFHRIKEIRESATDPTKTTREGRHMTCSNCKGSGHNKKGCTGPIVVEPPSQPRKRGRPRKNHNESCWSIQNAPKRRKTKAARAGDGAGTSAASGSGQPSQV